MKFKLVFKNSGDEIPLEVIDNQSVFEYFLNKVDSSGDRLFVDRPACGDQINSCLNVLDSSINSVNQVFSILTGTQIEQHNTKQSYLDQNVLNRIHCNWALSQNITVNIDQLRFSSNTEKAELGNQLHDMYPDEIRDIRVAEALDKLGYIDAYESINKPGIHRTETQFNDIEYSTSKRYDVFDNPYKDSINITNGWSNLSLGYTYLGRKYYDKFINFDTNLDYQDHFNFNKLEYTFNLSLRRPESIPFSWQFLKWASKNNVPSLGLRAQIANIPDLEDNLTRYRTIVYNNSVQRNKLTIEV